MITDNLNKACESVLVVLNIWKRNHLEEQLVSIINQSFQPSAIWILQFENHVKTERICKKYRKIFPNINVIKSELNLKYFGRFCIIPLIDTKYTLILDDDVILGKKWIETCVSKCFEKNAIISPTGRIMPPNDFKPELCASRNFAKFFIGDCYNNFHYNYCLNDEIVDYGCNSYFMKTDWIKIFWSVWPLTFLSGEDIHLSFSCKLGNNINTIVPQQLSEEYSGNIRKAYGFDSIATWRNENFISTREKIFKYFIVNLGFRPKLWDRS